MATEVVVTRATLAAAIAAKRAKQARMPAHWEKRREDLAKELEDLVLKWLAAE